MDVFAGLIGADLKVSGKKAVEEFGRRQRSALQMFSERLEF